MNIPPLRLWMAPVALVVMGGVIGAVFAAKSVAASNDTQIPAVEAAFSEAMRVRVVAGDLPASYIPDGKPVTAQVLQEAQAQAQQEMQNVFTGQALTQLEPAIDAAIQRESNGFMVGLGGGVDWTHFDQVSIGATGTTAYVKAHFDAWSKLAQVPGPGDVRPATPHAIMVADATLVLQNGRWKVSNYLFNFADGGP